LAELVREYIDTTTQETLLSVKGIRKSFNDVEVLHGVDFDLNPGEIHGIVGQNGAGKSTLMKIINGVYSRDGGEVYIQGSSVALGSPVKANQLGVAMVFQEFSLIPTLSVADNMFLTREPLKNRFIDKKKMHRKAKQVFDQLDIDLDVTRTVGKLAVGTKQVVEIAKALSQDAKILILDEPTASLSSVEIDSLFNFLKKLKNEGIGIVFVTHHLDEIIEICDRVTVIRDGEVALSDLIDQLSLKDIIKAMIGKELTSQQESLKKTINYENPLLQVKDLSITEKLDNISFTLYQGEILGIAGVLGSGRSEILKAIYGLLRYSSGKIMINGEVVNFKHPMAAIDSGCFLVPEDRREEGIIAGQSLHFNILLPIWRRLKKFFFIQEKESRIISKKYVSDLDIVTTGIQQKLGRLSGGNQQKVVFAKSLATGPKILLLDDPTVGVDIGTKSEIAAIIRNITAEGNSAIFVSSEMKEMADLCDRILVLRRGKIVNEIDNSNKIITEERLMQEIQGVNHDRENNKVIETI